MNEIALQKISECLSDNDIFAGNKAEKSYARWAIYELMNRISARPFEFPDVIVEEFIFEMSYLIKSTNKSTKRHIFEIARDAAEDILTII